MTRVKPREARLPGYKTAKQAAEEWGYAYTYVIKMLNEQDRVPRALKIGNSWFIPDYVKEKHVRRHPGRPIKPLPPEENSDEMLAAVEGGVGERLHAMRDSKGWSQETLADEANVAQLTVSNIEIGKHTPRGSTLAKLADALDVEVADFYASEEE